MNIDLCDRCFKVINTFTKYSFLLPTKDLQESGKVRNDTNIELCTLCARQFIEEMYNFIECNAEERAKYKETTIQDFSKGVVNNNGKE